MIWLHQRKALAVGQGNVRASEKKFHPRKYAVSANRYLMKSSEAVTRIAGCQQKVTATIVSMAEDEG